ncbi:MAG: phosphoribosyltransferase family protein [Pseudomonadota bacterium]
MPRQPFFRDRLEAGQALAKAALSLVRRAPEISDPVVLALPRGGVPLAVEVAWALDAPLDLIMVRKIGVPGHPELAAAAVVDGAEPQLVINERVAVAVGLGREDLEPLMALELAEIDRRRGVYLKGRTQEPIKGRDAIVVDDGIATGTTVRAALKALALRGARSVSLLVPIAPPEVMAVLRRETDHAVCLHEPEPFFAVGAHYAEFDQVGDDEVVACLAGYRRPVMRADNAS